MVDFSAVRGFNYQPGYGSSGFELWMNFDAGVIETELSRGKRYFPAMNAVRWWLSHQAFRRNPDRFAARFETALAIADRLGLKVMPCLFNRWHSGVLDYGGEYVDHFYWRIYRPAGIDPFTAFLERIVGEHATDARIFAWDLCNEPFTMSSRNIPRGIEAEFGWLESAYLACKRLGAVAPVTVGIQQNYWQEDLPRVEPICDILSFHPYLIPERLTREQFEAMVDGHVEFARKAGKPLLATESCWGSLDDAERVETMRYHLGELKKRNIGWLAYLLHHSLIADAHRPECGPIGSPGYMAFIEADGSLRPGHEAFNDY